MKNNFHKFYFSHFRAQDPHVYHPILTEKSDYLKYVFREKAETTDLKGQCQEILTFTIHTRLRFLPKNL